MMGIVLFILSGLSLAAAVALILKRFKIKPRLPTKRKIPSKKAEGGHEKPASATPEAHSDHKKDGHGGHEDHGHGHGPVNLTVDFFKWMSLLVVLITGWLVLLIIAFKLVECTLFPCFRANSPEAGEVARYVTSPRRTLSFTPGEPGELNLSGTKWVATHVPRGSWFNFHPDTYKLLVGDPEADIPPSVTYSCVDPSRGIIDQSQQACSNDVDRTWWFKSVDGDTHKIAWKLSDHFVPEEP